MSKEQPMVIVVYMDRYVMTDEESMKLISREIQLAFEEKGGNTVTLFVPTDGTERIECINPVIATEEQIERINKLIEDVEKSFDLGHDLSKDDYDDYEGSVMRPHKGDD